MSDLNNIFKLPKLKHGVGDLEHGLCLMQMVSWFSGEDVLYKNEQSYISDHPKCASPYLATVGICLNDSADDEQRQRLWPFVWKLIDSVDPDNEKKRYNYITNYCQNSPHSWEITFKALKEAIELGKHGEEDPTHYQKQYEEMKQLLKV